MNNEAITCYCQLYCFDIGKFSRLDESLKRATVNVVERQIMVIDHDHLTLKPADTSRL